MAQGERGRRMTTFRPFRHDRSVINARGGILPELADAVRADCLAIAEGRAPSPPSAVPGSPLGMCVRGDLRRRRLALGLSSECLGKMIDRHPSVITDAELHGRNRQTIARIEAALAAAEQERA